MTYTDLRSRFGGETRIPLQRTCTACGRIWTVHARSKQGKGLAAQRAQLLADRCRDGHDAALRAAHYRAKTELATAASTVTLEDFTP